MGTELIALVRDSEDPVFNVRRLSLVLLLPFLPLGCGDSDYKPPVAPSGSASADGSTGPSKIDGTKRAPRVGKKRSTPGTAPAGSS
jgi:hypothetical protein